MALPLLSEMASSGGIYGNGDDVHGSGGGGGLFSGNCTLGRRTDFRADLPDLLCTADGGQGGTEAVVLAKPESTSKAKWPFTGSSSMAAAQNWIRNWVVSKQYRGEP